MTPGDTMPNDAIRAAQITTITTDLHWSATHWPDLHHLRLPGTQRRTTRRPLTRAARHRADHQARTEKAEQGLSVLGTAPAPMNVGVLDTLARLLSAAHHLAGRISWNAGVTDPTPPKTGHDYDAITRLLAHAATHLPAAADTDPDVLTIAERAARRIRKMIETPTAGADDGQVLTALCTWCEGATTHHPTGGQRTLTVQVVAGEPLIVCHSDVCDPPSDACGTWLFGRPAWPYHQWETLASHLHAA